MKKKQPKENKQIVEIHIYIHQQTPQWQPILPNTPNPTYPIYPNTYPIIT